MGDILNTEGTELPIVVTGENNVSIGENNVSIGIIANFRDDHPEINVKLVFHNQNSGIENRFNEGLYASNCKYLYFTASDDFIYPTFIKEHKRALQESPIVEGCRCEECKHKNYGFYSIPTMLSGVQHIAKGKISSYATEFKETKENIYIVKEMVRIIRQGKNKNFSVKMLMVCMDRFRFSPDWLRVIVDSYLEETQLRISERPEEE